RQTDGARPRQRHRPQPARPLAAHGAHPLRTHPADGSNVRYRSEAELSSRLIFLRGSRTPIEHLSSRVEHPAVKKVRPNNNLEPRSDSIRSEKALKSPIRFKGTCTGKAGCAPRKPESIGQRPLQHVP